MLTLARGMLTDLVNEAHSDITDALTTLSEAYETRGVTAFRLDNVEERQRTVDACLKVSLQHLETFTPPQYHATERYQELAVFPGDTDIPLAILQIYWASAGLQPWETKDLCIRLHRLSLLLDCDLGAGTIRLHEVLRSYLIQCAGSHLSTLHARLLDTCWQKYDLTCWADLPQSETYLWCHLIFHLCQADRQEALQATLTGLHYLIYKVLYAGVSELEADLVVGVSELEADLAVSISELKTDLALASPQSFAQASFPPVAELYRYIARFGHLLLQVHTFAEVGEILLNHLTKELATEDQRRVLEGEFSRPFLAPWYPLPNRVSSLPMSNEIRYLGRALSCAVSPDRRFIVSPTRTVISKYGMRPAEPNFSRSPVMPGRSPVAR